MVSVENVQEKIGQKIIEGLGSTVTRNPFSSQTTDKWGDATITYGTPENIKSVPYDYIEFTEDYQPFGDLQTGEVVMAFKYDQELQEKDTIEFRGDTFIVKEVEAPPLQDSILLKLARLSQQY